MYRKSFLFLHSRRYSRTCVCYRFPWKIQDALHVNFIYTASRSLLMPFLNLSSSTRFFDIVATSKIERPMIYKLSVRKTKKTEKTKSAKRNWTSWLKFAPRRKNLELSRLSFIFNTIQVILFIYDHRQYHPRNIQGKYNGLILDLNHIDGLMQSMHSGSRSGTFTESLRKGPTRQELNIL